MNNLLSNQPLRIAYYDFAFANNTKTFPWAVAVIKKGGEHNRMFSYFLTMPNHLSSFLEDRW